MMMMTSIDTKAILARIAGDKRKVGAKIAKELESVEIIISDKKNDKNVIERHKDANGKTTITLYEQNIGTKNKEAIAAYYLSLEGTKMLIAEKSTLDETKLETNAENLIAANEVAFGIVNETETSAEAKAQLTVIRADIDNEVAKFKVTTGNSDAVEVLAAQGIIGLDSVEGRSKKINSTEAKSDSNTNAKTESSSKSEASASSSSSNNIATPRSVFDGSSLSSSTDDELVSTGNGKTITRKEARAVLKAQMPTMTDEQINTLVGKLPMVSATSTSVANATDMFNMSGTLMTREQATARILSYMPTAKPEDIDTFLTPYKVAGGTAASLASNPNEQVEFMGQKLPRSLAITTAKQLFPTLSEVQINAMLKPVLNLTTPITNPLVSNPLNPLLTTPTLANAGYNPALFGVQPSTVFNNGLYTNPSVFSTSPTVNPFLNTGFQTGVGSFGRTASGLPIVKSGA
jgi:hypothetical protein